MDGWGSLAWIFSTFLDTPITFIPFFTKDVTIDSPIPTLAPVTKAIFPTQRSITSCYIAVCKVNAPIIHVTINMRGCTCS